MRGKYSDGRIRYRRATAPARFCYNVKQYETTSAATVAAADYRESEPRVSDFDGGSLNLTSTAYLSVGPNGLC